MSDIKVLTFAEKERRCEEIFRTSGQFWHLYTDGTKMGNIFMDDKDFKAGISILAAVMHIVKPEVELVTFVLMKNHLHLILCGRKEHCLHLFEILKDKYRRVFRKAERGVDWSRFMAEILPIDSLKTLRNEIIYAHRNPFVASPEHTPVSYPWSGGCAYFNPMIKEIPTREIGSLSIDAQRRLTRSKDISPMHGLRVAGDSIYIPSFCNIRLGESLFTDARSYFLSLTRNAEAFSTIAARLKDSVFLTEDEIYTAATSLALKNFNTRQLALLNPGQRLELAKDLHFRYNASTQQLRRILKLELSVLNELFPQ